MVLLHGSASHMISKSAFVWGWRSLCSTSLQPPSEQGTDNGYTSRSAHTAEVKGDTASCKNMGGLESAVLEREARRPGFATFQVEGFFYYLTAEVAGHIIRVGHMDPQSPYNDCPGQCRVGAGRRIIEEVQKRCQGLLLCLRGVTGLGRGPTTNVHVL